MKRAFWMLSLMALVVSMMVSVAQAQPRTGGGDNQPAEEKGGAASAKECMTQAMEALKTKKLDAFKLLLPPDQRAMFEQMAPVFEAIEVKEYSLGEVKEEGDSASAKSTWTATLDVDKLVAAYMEFAKKQYEQAGMTAEQIEQAMAAAKPHMAAQFEDLKKRVEKKTHIEHAVKIDGRWYVGPSSDDEEGAEEGPK